MAPITDPAASRKGGQIFDKIVNAKFRFKIFVKEMSPTQKS